MFRAVDLIQTVEGTEVDILEIGGSEMIGRAAFMGPVHSTNIVRLWCVGGRRCTWDFVSFLDSDLPSAAPAVLRYAPYTSLGRS
jgi:hypothetical protein